MKKLFKKNINISLLVFLLPIPLIINNLINFFSGRFYFGFQNTSGLVEFYNILIAFFIFLFYLYFGKLLQKIFKTEYITSAIVIFWLLLFGIDNTLLIFTKLISFQQFTFFIFVLMIVFFIIKNLEFQYLIKIIVSLIFLKLSLVLIQNFYMNPVTLPENLFTSDEQVLWYPALQGIFENNYYSLLTNNPFPGYGLFTAYIGALNSFMLIGFGAFQYYLAINYLFIFLFFTFIYEISKSKKSFVLLSVLFLSVILSSHWFTYVFFGSLLSEVISSFCFGVLFTEIVNRENKQNLYFVFLLFSFGFIYFSRQFISTLVILFIIYQALKLKKISVLVGLYGFVLKILQSIILPNTTLDPYINEREFSNIAFNLENVLKMVKQFLIDKPVTYLIFVFFILVILNFKNQFKNADYYLFLSTNFFLVVALMIFIWRKDDVQSSYRYLLNAFYLIAYPMSSSLDMIFTKFSEKKRLF